MAFRVFTDPGQGAYFVLLIVSALLSITGVGLRFYATSLARRKPGLEDWLAFCALAVFIARIGVAFKALDYINGRSTDLANDREAYENAEKMIFVADIITLLDQCFAKWSICALYYRIFSVRRVYGWWLRGIAFVQLLLYFVLVILQCLQCQPINKFWQWWQPGYCMPFSTLLLAIEPLNSLIDFALVILAMLIIRSLHMKTEAKWKLRFLFGLGGLAGVFGFIKVGIAYNPDEQYTSSAIAVWAVIQSVVAIVCCCAPVYKPLFPRAGFWSRLRSRVTLSSLRERRKLFSNPRGSSGRNGSEAEDQAAIRRGWFRLNPSRSKVGVASQAPQVDFSRAGYALGSIHVSRGFDVD